MCKKYRVFALYSGGLDSLLSIKYMEQLGYEVVPIFFKTPFFGPKSAIKCAEKAGIKVEVIDITDTHLEMLKNPRYGFGKNLNPCIDCHGLMFATAMKKMEEYNIDFIISGEVLGQRPMSQKKNSMNAVGKLSGNKDLIIRPLCQRLLADTLPIREGWVKKEEMLDIQGRSRARQMQMAKEMGIEEYNTPGGGCLLTDTNYCKRLKDLFEYDMVTSRNLEYLKWGRHFRLNADTKLVIGRTKYDNESMTEYTDQEIVLKSKDIAGPLGIINSKNPPTNEELELACSILLRYNNKVDGSATVSYGLKFQLENDLLCESINNIDLDKYKIN